MHVFMDALCAIRGSLPPGPHHQLAENKDLELVRLLATTAACDQRQQYKQWNSQPAMPGGEISQ